MKSILLITVLFITYFTNAQEIMKFNNQGYLGIGTSSPVHRLTVKGVTQIQRDENHFFNIHVDNSDNGYINLGGASSSTNRIVFQLDGVTKFVFTKQGDLTLSGGNLVANGNIYTVGGSFFDDGTQIADYVFSENYHLISIEEQGLFMKENKHLPKVDSEKQIKDTGFYDMAIRREQILEEVEKAHLYIQQLNEMMKEIREKNEELSDKVDTLMGENIKLKQEIGKMKKS